MKFRIPEIFLGSFLTIAVFAMGMTFSRSYYSHPIHQNSAQHAEAAIENQAAGKTAPAASADAGEQHEQEETKSEFWSAKLSDWALVGFTGLLVLFTYRLWRSTDRLWEAGEKQFRLARQEFEASQRAFIHLDGFKFELTTRGDLQDPPDLLEGEPEWHATQPDLVIRRFAVQPRWKNSGNTPPKNLRIKIDWRTPPYAVLEPRYAFRGEAIPFFIPPNAVEAGEVIEITGAMHLINWSWHPVTPEPMIHIWGRADYEDVFGKPHFVEWCHRVRFSRTGGEKKLRVGTIQWGKYNRTDEDART